MHGDEPGGRRRSHRERVRRATRRAYLGRSSSATASIRQTNVGPSVDERQMRTVLEYVDIGRTEGARLVRGGTRLKRRTGPRLFRGAGHLRPRGSRTCASRRKRFSAPSCRSSVSRTTAAALTVANDVRFGLSASVYTSGRRCDVPVRRQARRRHHPRKLADGRRRSAHPVRRHEGDRRRPARDGSRRDRLLHRTEGGVRGLHGKRTEREPVLRVRRAPSVARRRTLGVGPQHKENVPAHSQRSCHHCADDYVADVYCDNGKIAAIGVNLPAHTFPADRTIDASGQYVMPGGIDVHTHLNMPFGGTTSADDFECGTIAAAFGGTTSLVDFAIQYRGQTMRHALDDWRKQGRRQGGDRLRLSHDRHRACRTPASRRWIAWSATRASPASSSSWPTPACSWWTMRRSFARLRRTGDERRPGLHARRERRGDRRAGEGGAAQRPDRAEVSRADAAEPRGGRSNGPRHRARGDGPRSHLHRPPLGRRRARKGQAGAGHGTARVRGDLPAVSVPLVRQLRRARFRRREVRHVAAAARKMASGRAVEGARRRTTCR